MSAALTCVLVLLGGFFLFSCEATATGPHRGSSAADQPAGSASGAKSAIAAATDWSAPGVHQEGTSAPPVDAVVLVDESGTLDDSLELERQAAQLIVTAGWWSDTRISVLGFGGVPPGKDPGKDENLAVDGGGGGPCFALTLVQAYEGVLRGCVAALRQRAVGEGRDSDYAAALGQALNLLGKGQQQHRRRVIYLLTDGHLDLGGSGGLEGYGAPSDATRAARERIRTRILPEAAKASVEIWPIAFTPKPEGGRQVEPRRTGDGTLFALDELVRGNAATVTPPPGCAGDPAEHPRIPWLRGPSDLTSHSDENGLLPTLAASRCLQIGDPIASTAKVGGATAEVRVPAGVAMAQLMVFPQQPSHDPWFSYYLPADDSGAADVGRKHQVPANGPAGESTYTVSQPTGPGQVASLMVKDPRPGTWTVDAQEPFTALPVWSASLRITDISPEPAPPGEGEDTRVRVSVRVDGLRSVFGSDAWRDKIAVQVWLAQDEYKSRMPLEDPYRSGQFTGSVRVPKGVREPLDLRAALMPDVTAQPALCRVPKNVACAVAQETYTPPHAKIEVSDPRISSNRPVKGQVRLWQLDPKDLPQIVFKRGDNVDPRDFRLRWSEQPLNLDDGTQLIDFEISLSGRPGDRLQGLLEVAQRVDPQAGLPPGSEQLVGRASYDLARIRVVAPTVHHHPLPWLLLLVPAAGVLGLVHRLTSRRRRAADAREAGEFGVELYKLDLVDGTLLSDSAMAAPDAVLTFSVVYATCELDRDAAAPEFQLRRCGVGVEYRWALSGSDGPRWRPWRSRRWHQVDPGYLYLPNGKGDLLQLAVVGVGVAVGRERDAAEATA